MSHVQVLMAHGGAAVYLEADSYTEEQPAAAATCGVRVDADGSMYVRDDFNLGSYAVRYNWLKFGSSSAYEVRATATSGSFSTSPGTLWYNLGTDRTYAVTQATVGSKSCTATFEIRDATSLVVLASESITLTAMRNS
jgi:hypothetical protein